MRKTFNIIKKYKYVFLLLILCIASHLYWFDPRKILTFSDWYYWPLTPLRELFYSEGTWINHWDGFGQSNIQLYFNGFQMIWSLLANLGLGFNISSRLTVLIPISILGFVSPYILIKKITKDNLIAFTIGLFYGSATYFLDLQTAHLYIAFFNAIAPLIVYFFMNAFEKNKIIDWIKFAFVFTIGIIYEVRIGYIFSIILFFYFLFFYGAEYKKYIKGLFLSGFLLILLNLFWLLPLFLGHIYGQVLQIANRGLFGNQLFNLNYAFTLFQWSWTGYKPNQTFDPQHLPLIFWIVPLIVFFTISFKKIVYRKEMMFFLLITLIGIFFAKQSANPFPYIYYFMYTHFPGFNLFREASKFYLLIDLGYAVLIAYVLLNFKTNIINKKINYFRIFIFLLLTISFLNLFPLFTTKIQTLFVPRHIPSDYLTINSSILGETEYYRILSVPTYSRWVVDSNLHPRISFIDEIYGEWKNILPKNLKDNSEAKTMMDLAQEPYFNNLLDISSIKYVLVPLEDKTNDDNFFIYYGGSRNYYINSLNKLSFLRMVNLGNTNALVFQNQNYRPHIYKTNSLENIFKNIPYDAVKYQSINPTEYKVYLGKLQANTFINFSEGFHSEWKIRAGDFSWFDAITKPNYFLPDKFHIQNNAGLNSFLINSDYIKKNYPNLIDKQNVQFTIFFKPQAYYYFGIMVSVISLISIILFITGLYFLKIFKK